jgi:hypothetical protein
MADIDPHVLLQRALQFLIRQTSGSEVADTIAADLAAAGLLQRTQDPELDPYLLVPDLATALFRTTPPASTSTGAPANNPLELDLPTFHPQGMGLGLENLGIDTTSPEVLTACRFGWDEAVRLMSEELEAAVETLEDEEAAHGDTLRLLDHTRERGILVPQSILIMVDEDGVYLGTQIVLDERLVGMTAVVQIRPRVSSDPPPWRTRIPQQEHPRDAATQRREAALAVLHDVANWAGRGDPMDSSEALQKIESILGNSKGEVELIDAGARAFLSLSSRASHLESLVAMAANTLQDVLVLLGGDDPGTARPLLERLHADLRIHLDTSLAG